MSQERVCGEVESSGEEQGRISAERKAIFGLGKHGMMMETRNETGSLTWRQ